MLGTVDVRRPDLPDDDQPAPHARPQEVAFAVPTRVLVAKLGLAAVLAVASLILGSGPQRVIGLLAAAAVAVYGLRDVLARERLRADADGLVAVRGYSGRRRLTWAEIEAVRVDARQRLGARTELLEIDTGAEIYQFSRYDLGTEPAEALSMLSAVWRP
jgi:hypothetical protein